jgi:hypothetical protein
LEVFMRGAHVALTALIAVVWATAMVNGCSATSGTGPLGTGGLDAGTKSDGGTGGGIDLGDGGDAGDAIDESIVNPCGSKCGPMELCDEPHIGLDDNCNYVVDEGCPCTPGAVHWCFKGDPSFRNTPGCYDGSMTCSEIGVWGDCLGGVHATPTDNCFANNPSCHAITAIPGAKVDLKPGTGTFSASAVPGSEKYTVACPTGVSQCPTVVPLASYTPIQSGEYTVTYSKMVAGNSNPQVCSFPLIVGARGLRVELSWEHPAATGVSGVDLDLHVHQPPCTTDGDPCTGAADCCSTSCTAGVCGPGACQHNGATCTTGGQCCSGACTGGACAAAPIAPWSILGAPQDCTWSSCTISSIKTDPTIVPHWFPDSSAQPAPCNWDVQTSAQSSDNTCYDDPRGAGALWQSVDMGCHNPRSDIDNRQCDISLTDPSDPNWCGPENVNVDYPPAKKWFRVGVHYYRSYQLGYDVHPEIKIFCDGALSADLGPHSFYSPEAPVTFSSGDAPGIGTGNRFWLAADVAFVSDACGQASCVVQPLYADPVNKTPLFAVDTAVRGGAPMARRALHVAHAGSWSRRLFPPDSSLLAVARGLEGRRA